MRFGINRSIHYGASDRVLILEREEDYFDKGTTLNVKYFCCALVMVTEDFDMKDPSPFVTDSCSIQIRPKGIFKSNKGYYYKSKGTIYLTEQEVFEMLDFNRKAKVLIKSKYEKIQN